MARTDAVRRRRVRRALWVGVPVVLVAGLVAIWDWDWFIPLVEPRLSAAAGRRVTLAHVHVHLGRRTRIVADDVVVADPAGFAGATPFARVAHVGVVVDVLAYVLHRRVDIPSIDLDHPVMEVASLADGRNNYTFHLPGGGGPGATLGRLTIEEGQVHAALATLEADVTAAVGTRPAEGLVAAHGQPQEIAAEAHGTYAGQPITGTLSAGSLLALRDTRQPYPIDLHLANGATHVALAGTVQDLFALAGADLRLDLSGEDMANLFPLTGIPIPTTPAYRVAGHLTYAGGKVRFDDIDGLVGHSDLEGSVAEAPGTVKQDTKPGGTKPDVTLDLTSRRVDLADLGGFIGAKPARATPAERRDPAPATRGVLPSEPIDIPRLEAADVHLRYHAGEIAGRSVPLDALSVALDVVDGAITVHPVSFKVGTGDISGDIAIMPLSDRRTHLKATVDFNRVDVARLLAATHMVTGAGSIGGKADIDATGNSIASWAADGNGGLTVAMSGGDLDAVLVSLSGLEFGNALAAAIGLPQQTHVRCFVGDLTLRQGIVETRTLVLDTGVAIVRGAGTVDLRDGRIDARVGAKAKHLSIGSVPTPIDITGTLADPVIRPEALPLLERGAAATALGFIAPPLALLATVQLGVGDPHSCDELVADARAEANAGTEGAPLAGGAAQAGGSGLQFPTHPPAVDAPVVPGPVPGHGDAAIRALNQEELDRLARGRK